MLTCEECQKQKIGSSDACLACPEFHVLFVNAESNRHADHNIAATGHRMLQAAGISVAVGGAIAGMLDLPVVGSSMAFFGFGLCLADILSID